MPRETWARAGFELGTQRPECACFLIIAHSLLLQIRTGLSSEKLFPLEELFYKHGNCYNKLYVWHFIALFQFELGESFDRIVVVCYLRQGELRVVYDFRGERLKIGRSAFPFPYVSSTFLTGPCVAPLVVRLFAVYNKEKESRGILFKCFVSFQRTEPGPGMSHIISS